MAKKRIEQPNQVVTDDLFSKVIDLLQKARTAVVKTVNYTMVYTYYEIGRMIVEDEQNGESRAEYGKQILQELSKRLTQEFGKGFSLTNLEQMRFFYKAYSIPQTLSEELQITEKEDIEKSSTVLTKSFSQIPQTVSAKLQTPDFQLSWSHYLKLMRISDVDERRFYEI
ncbi:MAG: DUF1016 N-terminal domain-containing protein, partial [Bacteroidales bacterium]|nr:DUF1016 N-terminal domain-containing protein [Bacteroidales bacterium]